MKPLDVLRYHVTGAIERGEASAIVEIKADDAAWFRRQTIEQIGRELRHVASSPREPASWVAALLFEIARRFSNNEAPAQYAEHCLAEWRAYVAGRDFEIFPRGFQPLKPRPYAIEDDE